MNNEDVKLNSLTLDMCHVILGGLAVCESEGISGCDISGKRYTEAEEKLLQLIFDMYPELKEIYYPKAK